MLWLSSQSTVSLYSHEKMCHLSVQKHKRAHGTRSSSSVSRVLCSQMTRMQSQPSTPVLHIVTSCSCISDCFSTPCVFPICSLKDMLYKRRMERQLAAARGEGPAPERAPDDVSHLASALVASLLQIQWRLYQPQCLSLRRSLFAAFGCCYAHDCCELLLAIIQMNA